MTKSRKAIWILGSIISMLIAIIGAGIIRVITKGYFRSNKIALIETDTQNCEISVNNIQVNGKDISFEVSAPGQSENVYLLTEIREPRYCVKNKELRIEAFVHEIPREVCVEGFPTQRFSVISCESAEHVKFAVSRKTTLPYNLDYTMPKRNTWSYVVKDIFLRTKYWLGLSGAKDSESFYDFEDEDDKDVDLNSVDTVIIKIGYIKNPDMSQFKERELRSLHAQHERFLYITYNQIIATWKYALQ